MTSFLSGIPHSLPKLEEERAGEKGAYSLDEAINDHKQL